MHTIYPFVFFAGIQLQSSKILDELENQGIIPVGQRAGAAGEAYSIIVGTCCTKLQLRNILAISKAS